MHLGGSDEPPSPADVPGAVRDHVELLDRVTREHRAELIVTPPKVIVAAPDRQGLLADVAGTLALFGLSILSADVTSSGAVALDTFVVEPSAAGWPAPEALTTTLHQVLSLELDLESALDARARTYASAQRRWSARPLRSSVEVDNAGSSEATIFEIRSPDRIGLLYRLTASLAAQGLDVSAARVATIGGDVVDAFYVTSEGSKLAPGPRLDAVVAALEAVLNS